MFFSVIIPTYNRAAFLSKSISSVVEQSFEDWELIVVDDGSTDDTKTCVERFSDARIKYVYQENAERSAARNNGITHASGTYILFLDSDDVLQPDTLAVLHDFIHQHGEPVAVFGTTLVYEENVRNTSLWTGATATELLSTKSVIPVSQCAHRDCFIDNRFDTRFTLWEDTHVWLRILQQFPVLVVPAACIRVAVHQESSVFKTFHSVEIKDAHRYRDAVSDLLNYPDLFPLKDYEQLLNAYIFSKYQMYIYQARMNKQYGVALQLLTESRLYQRKIGYHVKTWLKVMAGKTVNIYFR